MPNDIGRLRDWSKVDFHRPSKIIAAEQECASWYVSRMRRKFAPETINQYHINDWKPPKDEGEHVSAMRVGDLMAMLAKALKDGQATVDTIVLHGHHGGEVTAIYGSKFVPLGREGHLLLLRGADIETYDED